MTTKVASFNNSKVFQKYCDGKSLDQIAVETTLSKGTVYNLVKRWKDNLGSAGIEEIREFAIIVRKSGMTIQECAQGFRFAQILKEFGINDEFEDGNDSAPRQDLLEEIKNETIGWDGGKKGYEVLKSQDTGLTKRRNQDTTTKNELHFFIEDIYNNCKKYNIKPSDFIRWIKDLSDFYPSLECEFLSIIKKEPDLSLSTDKEDEFANRIYLRRAQNRENNDVILKNYEVKGDTSRKQTNEKNVSIEIPFISQVSYYIKQIKLEHKEREQYRKSLYDEISFAENKKINLENNLKETIDKNNNILTHLEWYNFLKQNLADNHNMNLDDEIIVFSSIIRDFKKYNYNFLDIINEYKQIRSLSHERDHIQNDIDVNIPVHQNLFKQIDSFNCQLDVSRQTMKIYSELIAMGFGLKKLKQLYYTIFEISLANHVPVQNAVAKFLNDIEDQYDSKLGFEIKIKELRSTMDELKDEILEYKSNLQIQSLVAPSLLYLSNNGVTNEDIINMSQLVVSFQNSTFLDDASSQSGNIPNNIGMNNNTNKNIKNKTWKLMINELQSIRNLYSKIEKLTIHCDELELEISLLNALKG
ncbi:hypothetical protein [Candidatus Nitrosocosmicus arcticus]|uniref:hypothetical protein n=1 Tax=Candidatus Nitrosocosmicus arcticus TaxID=2035267 RepID=UPI0011A097E6|nr:hypothetical protein [Candidatus Nitrosocosmicus arcticus]